MTRFVSLALSFLLLAGAMIVPVQANKPAGGASTCSAETAQDGIGNEDGDNVFCQIVITAFNVDAEPLIGSGVAYCHHFFPNTPLACGNSAGSMAGAGGASYNVDSVASGTHRLTAWVQMTAGVCGVQAFACGFD